MSQTKRIIPCLYLSESTEIYSHNKNIISFEDSFQLIDGMVKDGMQELTVMLISNIENRRKPFLKFLTQLREKQPQLLITAGGGIHVRSEVSDMIKTGVSRILLNSVAVRNPELINYISGEYGPEFISVNIDTKKSFDSWKVYISGGKSRTEMDAINWSKLLELRGASQLYISSASRSNQIELLELLPIIKNHVEIPVIAVLHSVSKEEILNTLQSTPVDGIASTSYFLKNTDSFAQIKHYLNDNQITVAV
jgi:cyclase